MFTEWQGKRVILFVHSSTPHINYVGTLEKSEGPLTKLTNVTPMRETRKLEDMVINMTCPLYSNLELVVHPEDDPSQQMPTA